MSTQQDINAAGSESSPPMLNKENYVPWSSRLLQYAKSRPNGKLIHNSIINGLYVRRMIPEPCYTNREVPVNETFHVQTDDELTEKELKQIEADDQAIQTILLGLPEDIYVAVDSCETAQEIWLRVQQMMKGSDIGIQEKKAKLFNKWERKKQMVGGNGENQFRQYARKNVGNLNGYNAVQNVENQVAQNLRVQNVRNQNGLIGVPGNGKQTGNDNIVAARTEGITVGHNDLDEIEEVNANCILMANLQQASTSGTQTDKAPVYDSDESAEYTELLDPIPEPHQVPQNDHNVISEVTSMEQNGETIEQHPENFEETRALYDSLYQNLAIEVEKVNSVNRKLKKTNADLTTELAIFKNQEKCFEISQEKYDKLKRCYQQSVYQEKRLSKKINALHLSFDSFYHTEQKMALGYQNPFYLKQAQKKQQSLYDGKVLLIKRDPPVVHDLEETLQLTQESREKMKQLNKEIKPANYTKINHHLEDTTPSVARKFLNEEATKFVGDFKSLTKEADDSLAKHKALELEIKRLLRAVFSQDIMSVVQKASVVDTLNLKTKLERMKECFENCIVKKENEYAKLWNDCLQGHATKDRTIASSVGDLKGKSKDTSCVSDTLNPLSCKLENKNVELEFLVLNYAKENAHLKTTYKNLFDSISVSRIDNTKTRRPHPRSNTKNDKVPSVSKSSRRDNLFVLSWFVDKDLINLVIPDVRRYVVVLTGIYELRYCAQCLIKDDDFIKRSRSTLIEEDYPNKASVSGLVVELLRKKSKELVSKSCSPETLMWTLIFPHRLFRKG
uniref:Uncharacterized protein n=1 Tax=Tanacetum cinerariifolium TaxID=118510 RepID=A0A6L2MTV6_TANCI|nr:hypothetical protein [Tanacetum cinerariifolium]